MREDTRGGHWDGASREWIPYEGDTMGISHAELREEDVGATQVLMSSHGRS